jgi:hypothetical protein
MRELLAEYREIASEFGMVDTMQKIDALNPSAPTLKEEPSHD